MRGYSLPLATFFLGCAVGFYPWPSREASSNFQERVDERLNYGLCQADVRGIEIRVYAEAVGGMISNAFPRTWNLFVEGMQ